MKVEKVASSETWSLFDDDGVEVETGFHSAAEAEHAMSAYEDGAAKPAVTVGKAEGDEDEDGGDQGEEKTEHNPHGLSAHERIANLIKAFAKHGFKFSESVHPAQNANTAPDKFAKRAEDGQNALTPEEKLEPIDPNQVPTT